VQVETEFIANVAELTHTSSNPRANNVRMVKDIVNFVSYLLRNLFNSNANYLY